MDNPSSVLTFATKEMLHSLSWCKCFCIDQWLSQCCHSSCSSVHAQIMWDVRKITVWVLCCQKNHAWNLPYITLSERGHFSLLNQHQTPEQLIPTPTHPCSTFWGSFFAMNHTMDSESVTCPILFWEQSTQHGSWLLGTTFLRNALPEKVSMTT